MPDNDDGDREGDTYEVTSWEKRTVLDHVSAAIWSLGVAGGKTALVTVALGFFLVNLGLVGLGVVVQPLVAAFTVLSIVPAFFIAVYVWESDRSHESLFTAAVTFLLSAVFTSFAPFIYLSSRGYFTGVGVLGLGLFFFVVIGPLEEFLKLLAVRIHAYDVDIDSPVDGAAYGAFAGLGFAFMENLLYLSDPLTTFNVALEVSLVRATAGPNHVLFSALAGYYLGLAKLNPSNRGPIVVKGLLIASLLHGTYNTGVTYLPGVLEVTRFNERVVLFAFIVGTYLLAGYLLTTRINRYYSVYP